MLRGRAILWCLRQRSGIRLILSNENLAKAYLKKAVSALNTMNAALKIEEVDWVATTAYYAWYFALYALLMKMGVKSEIHDCSIAVARLLVEEGILGEELVSDVSNSKRVRVDVQYYVEKAFSRALMKRNVADARRFVLEIEKIIENVTVDQVENVRRRIRSLRNH